MTIMLLQQLDYLGMTIDYRKGEILYARVYKQTTRWIAEWDGWYFQYTSHQSPILCNNNTKKLMEEKTQKFHHVVKTVVLVQKNKTGHTNLCSISMYNGEKLRRRWLL